MDALCSRPDLLGRLGRHYLTEGGPPGPLSPQAGWRLQRRPRLSLRPLASYRTLLLLLLLYLLGALLALGPVCSSLLLLAGALLHGLLTSLLGDKLKRH